MLADDVQDRLKLISRIRANRDFCVADICSCLPNTKLRYLVASTMKQDEVQDLRQGKRIDDVAIEAYGLGYHGRTLPFRLQDDAGTQYNCVLFASRTTTRELAEGVYR